MPTPATGRPPAGAYTFRVRILGGIYAPPDAPTIWREIELKRDQTLADLGDAIPRAFDFDDDHLWSFFLSGRPWDRATEYARLADPDITDITGGGEKHAAGSLRVADAPPRREFLFLFDYGDEWHFGVKVARKGDVEPGARYPRVVASHGEAPPQYPDLEGDWEDEDWTDEDDEDDWDEEEDEEDEEIGIWVPGSALEPPSFPPVQLAPLEDIQAAAAATPAVRRLRLLTEWTGAGRKLGTDGDLAAGDREELGELLGLDDHAWLDQVLAWAREVGLVRVYGGRLVQVKQRQPLLDDPLELLEQVLDVLPAVGADLLPVDTLERIYPDGFVEALLDLLTLLYVVDEPMPVEELTDHVLEEHLPEGLVGAAAGEGAGAEVGPEARAEVGRLLALSRDLGMIEASPAGGGDGDGPVQLTPLGTWLVNLLLRAVGAVAPVIGDAAGKDVAELIEAVADYDEQSFKAEVRAWGRERGDAAAAELASYVRTASGTKQRMLGLTALEEVGPGAEAEVRAMLGDPALRPHAQMWLVRNGFDDERSLDPETSALVLVETMAILLEVEGPAGLVEHLEELGPPAEQAKVVADLWRVPTPRAGEVLDAIGRTHPSAKVAKAARTAAHKLRSAGGRG